MLVDLRSTPIWRPENSLKHLKLTLAIQSTDYLNRTLKHLHKLC